MMNYLMRTIPSGATYLQAIVLSVAAVLILSWFTTMASSYFMEMWRECFPDENKTLR